MDTQLFEQLIANNMELLSSIGIQQADNFQHLAEHIAEALLKGGKVIIAPDRESRAWAGQMVYILGSGDSLERPILPAINLAQICDIGDPSNMTTILASISKPDDCVLVVGRDQQHIASLVDQNNHGTYTISCTDGGTETNCVRFDVHERRDWYSALNLLSNFIGKHLEYVLFGQI